MNVLIISSESDDTLLASFEQNVEAGIEKIYNAQFDVVIIGKDIKAEDEVKLRKILSFQTNEILVMRQEDEQLPFAYGRAKFMWNNYSKHRGNISIKDINENSE